MKTAIRRLSRLSTGQMGVSFVDAETGEVLPWPLPEGYRAFDDDGSQLTDVEVAETGEAIEKADEEQGSSGGGSGNGFATTGKGNPFKNFDIKKPLAGFRSLFGGGDEFPDTPDTPKGEIVGTKNYGDVNTVKSTANNSGHYEVPVQQNPEHPSFKEEVDEVNVAALTDPYEEIVGTPASKGGRVEVIGPKEYNPKASRSLLPTSSVVDDFAQAVYQYFGPDYKVGVYSGMEPKDTAPAGSKGNHPKGFAFDGDVLGPDGKPVDLSINDNDKRLRASQLFMAGKKHAVGFGPGYMDKEYNGRSHFGSWNPSFPGWGKNKSRTSLAPDLAKQIEQMRTTGVNAAVGTFTLPTYGANIDPLGGGPVEKSNIVTVDEYETWTPPSNPVDAGYGLVDTDAIPEPAETLTDRSEAELSTARGIIDEVVPKYGKPISKTVVDVLLGEMDAGNPKDARHIASVIYNRAMGTGHSMEDVVSAKRGSRKEFDAYGKSLPKGVEKHRGMAEDILAEVAKYGTDNQAISYKRSDKLLGKGAAFFNKLELMKELTGGPHSFYTDGRSNKGSIGIGDGYKPMDYTKFGNRTISVPSTTGGFGTHMSATEETKGRSQYSDQSLYPTQYQTATPESEDRKASLGFGQDSFGEFGNPYQDPGGYYKEHNSNSSSGNNNTTSTDDTESFGSFHKENSIKNSLGNNSGSESGSEFDSGRSGSSSSPTTGGFGRNPSDNNNSNSSVGGAGGGGSSSSSSSKGSKSTGGGGGGFTSAPSQEDYDSDDNNYSTPSEKPSYSESSGRNSGGGTVGSSLGSFDLSEEDYDSDDNGYSTPSEKASSSESSDKSSGGGNGPNGGGGNKGFGKSWK